MLRISIALPFGVSIGPTFHFPLPAKSTIEIGEPFRPSEIVSSHASAKNKVDAVYDDTIHRIQAMMDVQASKRKFPIIG